VKPVEDVEIDRPGAVVNHFPLRYHLAFVGKELGFRGVEALVEFEARVLRGQLVGFEQAVDDGLDVFLAEELIGVCRGDVIVLGLVAGGAEGLGADASVLKIGEDKLPLLRIEALPCRLNLRRKLNVVELLCVRAAPKNKKGWATAAIALLPPSPLRFTCSGLNVEVNPTAYGSVFASFNSDYGSNPLGKSRGLFGLRSATGCIPSLSVNSFGIGPDGSIADSGTGFSVAAGSPPLRETIASLLV